MVNPKLRFKADDGTEYPDWKFDGLTKYCSVTTGNMNAEDSDENGKYRFFDRGIDSVKYLNSYFLDKEALIYPGEGASFLPKYFIGKFALHQRCYALYDFSPDLEAKFAYQYLLNKNRHFVNFAVGSTVKSLRLSTFKECLVALPSKEEQRKIAEFLGAFDSKVEAKEQQLEALQETKKGLLQQIFSQQLRFKADDGTEYPDWKQYKLGNLGSFKKGKGLSKDQLSEEGTPCILYGQLYTDYNEVIKSVVSKTNASLDNAVFSEGNEVLLPCSGETSLDISRATFLPVKGVALGGDLHIITCNSNINGSLLSYIINSSLKKEIARIAQGATVVHTSASSLAKINVTYPQSLEEQRKIAEFLGAFDEKIEAVKRQLEALKEIKKGLLQQMFV